MKKVTIEISSEKLTEEQLKQLASIIAEESKDITDDMLMHTEDMKLANAVNNDSTIQVKLSADPKIVILQTLCGYVLKERVSKWEEGTGEYYLYYTSERMLLDTLENIHQAMLNDEYGVVIVPREGCIDDEHFFKQNENCALFKSPKELEDSCFDGIHLKYEVKEIKIKEIEESIDKELATGKYVELRVMEYTEED